MRIYTANTCICTTCVSRSQLTTGNLQLLRSCPSSPLAKQLTTDNWHLQSSRRSPNRRHQAKLDSYIDPKNIGTSFFGRMYSLLT